MAPNEDGKNDQPDDPEEQAEISLGGLSRIIKTTLLLPLDVVQMRLRYPDTWCVKMFRIMVNCKGCPGPYEVLSASMLQRRIYNSLRWGIYYCLYDAHKKACKNKGYHPLWQTTFLLTRRPIVKFAVDQESMVEARDYLSERRRLRERKVLQQWLEYVSSRLHYAVQTGVNQDWPLDVLGAAVLATTLLHPLDVFKVRLQLYPEVWGMSMLRTMLRCEGLRAPYTGLTASILRKATYTTSRLGTYYGLYEYHKRKFNGPPGLYEKLAFGMYSGIVGALVGCPSEVILVRMMADGPVDPYRRYRGIFDATTKICQTEGVGALWRGATLTMFRSAAISVSQIGTYIQARNYLMRKHKAQGFLLNLYTAMLSSVVIAVATLPLDTLKTRYQVTSNGNHRDVYQKFRKESGVLGLWRGFTPYYMRLTMHTLVTFYLLEMLYESHRTKRHRKKEDN